MNKTGKWKEKSKRIHVANAIKIDSYISDVHYCSQTSRQIIHLVNARKTIVYAIHKLRLLRLLRASARFFLLENFAAHSFFSCHIYDFHWIYACLTHLHAISWAFFERSFRFLSALTFGEKLDLYRPVHIPKCIERVYRHQKHNLLAKQLNEGIVQLFALFSRFQRHSWPYARELKQSNNATYQINNIPTSKKQIKKSTHTQRA